MKNRLKEFTDIVGWEFWISLILIMVAGGIVVAIFSLK